MSMMSDDLISRQAAVNALCRGEGCGNICRRALECLPSAQPEQRWTPVSEGLPRENGWYQCTVIVNDLPRTTELFYKNDKWLNNQRIGMFNTYDIYGYGHTTEKHKLSYQELISEFDWTENVVAWMPLPDPWKGEEHEIH